jgi:two-component system, NtrC family, sensor kinase
VPRRLAPKLILSLTILIAIVRGVSGFLSASDQEEQLVQNILRAADQLSRSITSATWNSMLADRRDTAYEVMKKIAEEQGIDRIRMFNKDGELVFSTRASERLKVDKWAEECNGCHSTGQPRVHLTTASRTRIVQIADRDRTLGMITPIYNEPACSSADCHAHPASLKVLGVLDIGMNLASVDRGVAAIRLRTVVVTLVEIALMGLLITFFIRSSVGRPIRSLIAGTKAVSNMQLDTPIAVRAKSGELRELAESFDAMRERLRQAVAENVEFTQHLEAKVEERTIQLKAAHQRLVQSDRLASLGQLAASVAHEINNPLSGVLNLSMLMRRILKDDGIPRDRVEEFRRYLGQVVDETGRVGRIVKDLLAFSRRAKPQSTDADLNAIVGATLSLVSHTLELADVTVDAHLADGLPSPRCDPSQIQQVVLNLVLNGAEAMVGGGRLSVTTSVAEGGHAVVLEVSDTGCGIPPDVAEKVFEPFFTTKEEGKGVGLGLAVVYGIVQAHNGEIEVHSEVGKGTTFRVLLPLGEGAQNAPAGSGAGERGA